MCMCVRTRWASSIKWSFKESLSLPAKTRPSDIQGVVKPGSVCVCGSERAFVCAHHNVSQDTNSFYSEAWSAAIFYLLTSYQEDG